MSLGYMNFISKADLHIKAPNCFSPVEELLKKCQKLSGFGALSCRKESKVGNSYVCYMYMKVLLEISSFAWCKYVNHMMYKYWIQRNIIPFKSKLRIPVQ